MDFLAHKNFLSDPQLVIQVHTFDLYPRSCEELCTPLSKTEIYPPPSITHLCRPSWQVSWQLEARTG